MSCVCLLRIQPTKALKPGLLKDTAVLTESGTGPGERFSFLNFLCVVWYLCMRAKCNKCFYLSLLKDFNKSFSAGASWYHSLHEQATHPINQMSAIAVDKPGIPHAFFYIDIRVPQKVPFYSECHK